MAVLFLLTLLFLLNVGQSRVVSTSRSRTIYLAPTEPKVAVNVHVIMEQLNGKRRQGERILGAYDVTSAIHNARGIYIDFKIGETKCVKGKGKFRCPILENGAKQQCTLHIPEGRLSLENLVCQPIVAKEAETSNSLPLAKRKCVKQSCNMEAKGKLRFPKNVGKEFHEWIARTKGSDKGKD
uniref:Cystatin domain-containing protein n=1 Tax=Trichuris muris TaxID=70415 RepID=A0A5S6R4Z7_TRIMR